MVTDPVARGCSRNIHPCKVAGALKVDEIFSIVMVMALGAGASHNKHEFIKVWYLRFMWYLVILYTIVVDINPGKQPSQALIGVFTK